MPHKQTYQRRESYYDRSGNKRWKTVTSTRTVYTKEEKEEQRRHLWEFLFSRRMKALPIVFGFILAATIIDYKENVADFENWASSQRRSSPIVYVTWGGDAYHTGRHYSGRSHKTTLFDAKRTGHFPCSVCKPVRGGLSEEQLRRRKPSFDGIGFWLFLGLMAYIGVAFFTFSSSRNKAVPNKTQHHKSDRAGGSEA